MTRRVSLRVGDNIFGFTVLLFAIGAAAGTLAVCVRLAAWWLL